MHEKDEKDEKVYAGYPTNKDEWIQTLDKWMPELQHIVETFFSEGENLTTLMTFKDWTSIASILNKAWFNAPDCPTIHQIRGWHVLCDLCSEFAIIFQDDA